MDKNTYMKLSIIVPVYNVKQYIDKCITSILDQSFKDFELILVDDGSIDGSGDVCEAYAKSDSRVQVYHQSNQGQAVARNFAIRKANGEYIGCVDSDDWIQPEMYEHLINAAQDKNADIVVCRFQTVSQEEKVIDILGYEDSFVMDKIKATTEILLDHKIQSFPWNKIYKRNLFDGIEYPIGRLFEDTATTYKLFYKSDKVVCIPYIGYNYRINPNSTIHEKRTDIQKFIKRELDNALAFHERYLFARSHEELKDVLPLCAFKAYQMIRSFIHLVEHKNIYLTKEQVHTVNNIMGKIYINDLSMFNMYERLDLVLYKINMHLLKMYLRLIAKIHPIEIEIK